MSSSGDDSPPIHKDKVEKMYQTELNGGYFQKENAENSKPYNEWRSENGHLFTPKGNLRDEHFVSNLGQNLQSIDEIVPSVNVFANNNDIDSFSPRYRQEPRNLLQYPPYPQDSPQYRQEPRNSPQYRQEPQDSPQYRPEPRNSPQYRQEPQDLPQYRQETRNLPTYRQEPLGSPQYRQEPLNQYQQERFHELQPYRDSPKYKRPQNSPLYQEPQNSPRYQYEEQHFSHRKPRYNHEITPPPRPNYYQNYSPNSPYFRELYYNHPQRPFPVCSCESKKKEKHKEEKMRKKQISDLYRIVYLQNQQLSSLQNQVRKLIEISVKNDESPDMKKKVKGSKEMRTFNLEVIEENQNITEKVSVGIMTSFIESSGKKSKVHNSSESSDSSSEEDEPVKKNKNKDDSYMLKGVQIPTLVENAPSPQNSFHLELQDYSSSSSTDESEISESESDSKANQVGWTFYDNVVGKVNNLLKTTTEGDESGDEIKNATLEQLKKLGISFVESETTPKRVTFDQRACKEVEIPHKLHSECDTSTRMNALATKYLEGHAGKMVKPKDAGGSSNTNLSFATMRYLERYCLVPKEKSPKNEEGRKKKRADKKKKNSSKSNKILDITAIKKQPKLLPKK